MVFSSGEFLLVFLPLFALSYWLVPARWRLWVLLGFSLVFYGIGERVRVLLLIGLGLANGGIGLALARTQEARLRRVWLWGAVAINLAMLGYFKYAGFLCVNWNALAGGLGWQSALVKVPQVALPLGISFFVFQGLSYVIDVYRREVEADGPLRVLTYLALFPQLVAGPIVRYRDVQDALVNPPQVGVDEVAQGVGRFIRGLAKKVLLADSLAIYSDMFFGLPVGELACLEAWVGALAYTLQIYFDFSGYSDMAIGLGRTMGFRFPENFVFPYMADSMRDFWHRWHCSLSTWFRDYLYIPLGGSRCSPARTYANLLTVFFLTGLWHGASWTFVVWGLWHGLWLLLGRVGGSWGQRIPRALRWGATMLIVMVGWVLFRAASFSGAAGYLRAMAGGASGAGGGRPLSWVDGAILLIACVACWDWRGLWWRMPARGRVILWVVGSLGVLLLALGRLGVAKYSPFLYFRF